MWQHKNRLAVLLTLALVVCAVGPVDLRAKPPAGGGTATGPGGTVYFSYVNGLWSMSGNDGSGKRQLNITGSPSRQTYGGHRWFLQTRYAEGDPLPQAWLVRDDGAEQELPLDFDLQVELGWGPGDVLMGAGRRWLLDGTTDPDSCGVYLGQVAFDAAGDLIDYDPPAMYAPLPVTADENGQAVVDIRWGWDCSPDLSRAVLTRVTQPGLWIVDLATGDTRQLTPDPCSSPAWSPDGVRIAYWSQATYDLVMSIHADGTGRKQLVRASFREWLSAPVWSPTGSHLLYRVTSKEFSPPPDEIYRIPADGGTKVNLTADIGGWFGGMWWR